MAVVIGSRQGPGRALRTTQGAEVKSNPEACGPRNAQARRRSAARMHTSACRPRGLVLVPTRELASQVQAVLAPLAQAVGLSVVAIYGGVPQNPQVARLRDRADIVVACPGRLADLIEQGHCHLGDVEISVIDEADHMADLGFLPVVRRLLDMTPPEGQRMLFSATLDAAVDVLARRFMNQPGATFHRSR